MRLKREPRIVHKCFACNGDIEEDDPVVFVIPLYRGHDPQYAHERCIDEEKAELIEKLEFSLEYGHGWEIEDE